MTDNLSIPRSDLQQCIDHVKAMQRILDRILEPPPTWTDTGSGAGYEEGRPYDPRD